MKLDQATVLVTGGGSGLGFEIARAFHARGARVVICGRDEARLDDAARRLPGIVAVSCDVSSDGALLRLRDELVGRDLAPSILVNNAAIQLHTDFLTTSEHESFARLDQEVATNFTGLVKLTTLMLPLLTRSASASIVNLTSGLAFTPKAGAPVYCATKAAVHAFSVALRYQLEDAASSVTLTEAVLPLVDTPMTRGRGPERLKMAPDRAARRVVQAVERGEREVHVGASRPFLLVHRALPGLTARVMRGGV